MDARETRWVDQVRGLLVGLALGDALGSEPHVEAGISSLRGGVASQLAAFTVEGLIRAHVRNDHKGIAHVPTMVWMAHCRWAFLQGIEQDALRERYGNSPSGLWPDGWLARVPALAERRGSAPATVSAVQRSTLTVLGDPGNHSAGWHGLPRSLPAAAYSPGAMIDVPQTVQEVAVQTHAAPVAQQAAVLAAAVVRGVLDQEPLAEAVLSALAGARQMHAPVLAAVERAFRTASSHPGDPVVLARLAPGRDAVSALSGAVYSTLSHPEPGAVETAVRFAATAPDRDAVASLTGSLLGAQHGIAALPVELVSRMELAWVLDTLARDLTHQALTSPGGDMWADGDDPHWFDRYPGW